ncbi:MAG: hypothetical protein ABIO05_02290 [Ferruginibacter sp.]
MKVAPGRLLFFFFILIQIISCKTNSVAETSVRYYYYPKTNVYYDSLQGSYSYSLDSGRNWKTFKAATLQKNTNALGARIPIDETDENIWKYNEKHRGMYGGGLYNIITSDTTALSNNYKVKEKKLSGKPDSVAPAPKKKRNIFQKIFGKKKN